MEQYDFTVYPSVDMCTDDDLCDKLFEVWQGDASPGISNGQPVVMVTENGESYDDSVERFLEVFHAHFPDIRIDNVERESF